MGNDQVRHQIRQKLHDLRGSLNVVAGFLNFVDRRHFDADQMELYEACKISVTKIVSCVNAIQDLSQKESVQEEN
jgi:signal transduction histidine kinase